MSLGVVPSVPVSPFQDPASPEAVRDAVERVLARAEFHPEESWITRAMDMVRGLLDWVGLDEVEIDEHVLFTLVAIFGLLSGVLLVRTFVRAARAGRAARVLPNPSRTEARERASALLVRADAASAAGDLRAALRLYWTALVVGLGERGRLEYREAWTNRELLVRGALDPQVASELELLLASIEAQEFGRAEVGADDVERLREECRARGLVAGSSGPGRSLAELMLAETGGAA